VQKIIYFFIDLYFFIVKLIRKQKTKEQKMKINIEKIADGFTCFGCEQDHYQLAIEASKESGKQICYDCAFASLKSQTLIEGWINKFSNYDREETYENEVL
jgi:transcription elongation factor Elf1